MSKSGHVAVWMSLYSRRKIVAPCERGVGFGETHRAVGMSGSSGTLPATADVCRVVGTATATHLILRTDAQPFVSYETAANGPSQLGGNINSPLHYDLAETPKA
ncbi:hypothetical protein R3P38DRAFT_2802479 [Favolaschia claudopus]|uniref:Uncharacterized protein n=1 Tax=Favolaschia claudopus TaxID=2862362 RepID=A0AAV9ZUY0_9AGAR